MVTTSGRLLRLLSLLESAPQRRGPELAEVLGVSTRTVRRDVDRLRQLGYPVHSEPGVGGAYRLAAGAQLPPLLFDDDEAVALVVGLRQLAADPAGLAGDAAARALGKVEQVLPPRLGREVATLGAMTVSVPWSPGPAVEPADLTTLAGACREQLLVRFTYVDRAGAATQRRVEPLRLVASGRRWYVVGFDLDRDDWRTFRVDRMAQPDTNGHRFTARKVPGGDIDAFVASRIEVPWPHTVRVRFMAPAEQVARGISARDGMVEAEGADRCVATLNGAEPTILAAYLGMFGVDFEIVEAGPDVVAALAVLADRAGRAAGPGGQEERDCQISTQRRQAGRSSGA